MYPAYRWLLDRLGPICGTFAVLVVSWLLYDASRDGPRWERYKVEHGCVLHYRPGEAGTIDEVSGSEGWLCVGPMRMIWKNPLRPGVAGQI